MAIVTITRPERTRLVTEPNVDDDGDIVFEDAASDADEEMDLSKVNAGTVNNTNLVTPGELVTDETTWMR